MISTTSTNMSLVSSILTDEILQTLHEEKADSPEVKEREMIAIATLLVSLMQRASKDFLDKKLINFDANPGDHGCQLRAVKVYEFAHSQELRAEAERIHTLSLELQKMIRERKMNAKKGLSTRDFFQKHFENITLSKKMAYLLNCYLLTVTQVVTGVDEDGFEATRTDPGKLALFSKTIDTDVKKKFRHQLIYHNGPRLSIDSITALRQIIGLMKGERPLLEKMFSDPFLRKVAFEEGTPPKIFSPAFFQVQVVLQHLKQLGATVVIRSVVKDKEKPIELFLKASEKGFEIVEEAKVDSGTPMVVFNGVIRKDVNREELAKKIQAAGFEKTMLVLIAQEPPYDRATSKLEDLKDEEALKLIREYSDQAPLYELDKHAKPFLAMRHIFCDVHQRSNTP